MTTDVVMNSCPAMDAAFKTVTVPVVEMTMGVPVLAV